ncbi:3-phenylpropionate MFS transporter [Telmatospirillum sp. J64-1]|uniref:3-phenylpropionate MFS transporter n=1 Tax=Telmatospirillum sp. J64-1 TaxID=2502183 RepID=UPI00115D5484|nr:3-phenylpropionate MFS transporter [Telmatospirillum sp. J64-1]
MKTISLRLALYYVGMFLFMGITLPYWPVWLEAQGMGAAEIGMLLAAAYAAKLGNPLIGALVDRRGDRKKPMILLCLGGILAYLLFLPASGFWSFLLLTVITTVLVTSLMPLGDNLTLLQAKRHGLDYGRIRLWGSVAFILASISGGAILERVEADIVLWLVVASLMVLLVFCLFLPDMERTARQDGKPAEKGLLWRLLRHPAFLTFLAATSLIQMSHMAYYGFATLHWRQAGLSTDLIGLLWAEGVLAEILLFAFSGALLRRMGIGPLLIVSALGCVLRWGVLGLTTDPVALAAAQLLHAATFGAGHLAAMHFLVQAAPRAVSARAQSLYYSITTGVASGLAMLAAGPLYAAFGGASFLVMAAISVLAVAMAWRLMRRWQGEELVL